MPADHAQDKLGAARAAVPAHEGRQAEHEARKPGESLGGEKEALGVMQRGTGQRRPRLGTMSAVWSWSLHGWKYGIHAGACSSSRRCPGLRAAQIPNRVFVSCQINSAIAATVASKINIVT